MPCKQCGGTAIEQDESKGMSYCTNCGEVCEENTIVSEVTFGEAASGAAIVQGSFVRAGQTRANMGGPGRFGSGQESREMTLYNSRRRIQRLATALGLSEHFVDTAQRYFQLALNVSFTRGRRALYVSSACLYIVCRTEKSSQMLIDFSDILQVSVFKLGATFAQLVNALNLRLPIVDPSMYISRFASMLEFGDKTNQVSLDAIRLVQRMDRDWIRTGRRPSGICGACLLISARMHNFRRSQREIIRVVKIADTTLRRRLDEFRATPSGGLTVADFRSLWLEQAADPPAFTNNRLKARKAMLAQQQHQQQQQIIATQQGDAAFDSSVERAIEAEFSTYLREDSRKLISAGMTRTDLSPDVATWSDVDDDEINGILLNKDEVQRKTEIWDRENKAFVEEQERRRRVRELEESSRKRRRFTKKKVTVTGATPLEAAQNMLATRRLSKKINYDILGKLLGDDDDGRPAKPARPHGMVPSRMPSALGTPARSGHVSPIPDDHPATLVPRLREETPAPAETIVYEEGQDDPQATAVDLAAAADGEDEDDEDFDEDEDIPYVAEYDDADDADDGFD
ncbi:transcription factor TFIIIB subunit brf1 [Coemansia sp. RSA 552]|nr:transcription factor TFIIIB subunit brf1 [Coemansia sp. RSA 552]